MSTDISMAARSHEENWLPILELAVEEVFEIMLGCRVKPASKAEQATVGGCTAMVGLAGALCGILTFSCGPKTARAVAKAMLGPEIADSEEQVSDALGEICNMIAGNFESGSAQMKATSQATFDRIANLLQQRDCSIRVEGHTDNVPIHNSQFSSNWELSAARATEIVRLLIVRDGYGPNRLSAAGYAEYHAIASNASAQGRSLNRRVDIVILRQGAPAPAAIQFSSPPTLPAPRATNSGALVPATALQPAKPSAAIGPKAVPNSGVSTAQ
jgi:outer membrane protein OmpA-like peptidoglycan-associated protein